MDVYMSITIIRDQHSLSFQAKDSEGNVMASFGVLDTEFRGVFDIVDEKYSVTFSKGHRYPYAVKIAHDRAYRIGLIRAREDHLHLIDKTALDPTQPEIRGYTSEECAKMAHADSNFLNW